MHLSCDKMLRIYSTKRDEEMSNKVSNPNYRCSNYRVSTPLHI